MPPDNENSVEQAARIFREWSNIDFVAAVLAIVLGLASIVVVKTVVPWLAARMPDRYRFYLLPWEPILRFAILIGVIVYAIPLFIKPSPENLLAILGASAVALGFAFKDYASSLIAGIVALYERPYRAGDWVQIGEVYGEVKSLGLRTVQILTPDDNMVAIPHSKIWDNPIYNANQGQRDLMVVAHFYVAPDHDGHQVRDALRDVALTSPFVQLDRPVMVIAAEQPWATHYQLKAYPLDGRDQFTFLTDLTLRGKEVLADLASPASRLPALAVAPESSGPEGHRR